MKKRIFEKSLILAMFLATVFLTCFAGGAFATVRNGFGEALKYDFEVENIAMDLGVNIWKDDLPSQSVNGDADVEFYCVPVCGEITSAFSNNLCGDEYLCSLILTVKAASNGKIVDIVQTSDSYGITIKNNQGYTITVDNLQKIYVSYGQQVSAGQIIGALNNDGKTVVSVYKDGVVCDPAQIF